VQSNIISLENANSSNSLTLRI